jgi:hypothetical protein
VGGIPVATEAESSDVVASAWEGTETSSVSEREKMDKWEHKHRYESTFYNVGRLCCIEFTY